MNASNLSFLFSKGFFATLENKEIAEKLGLETGKDYLLFHKSFGVVNNVPLGFPASGTKRVEEVKHIELSIYIGDYTVSTKILPVNEGCEKIGDLEYSSFEEMDKDWTNAEALQNYAVYGHALRVNTAGMPVK